MKKALIISIFTLIVVNGFSQTNMNCFKEIKKIEWNYSICIDTIMKVDNTNKSNLIIKQYKISKQETYTRKLAIKLEFNYENKTPQELQNLEFSKKTFEELKQVSRKDSILKSGEIEFYIVNRVFEDQKKELRMFSSAIGIYKSQYYSFQTFGMNNSSLNFLCKVLKRSSFLGEPKLTNDKIIKDNFLSALTSSLKNKKKLEEIFITSDIILSIIPEKEQESIKEQLPQIEIMVNDWKRTAYEHVNAMKKFNSVKIINSDFIRDNSQEYMTNYIALINLDCDGQKINYRLVCMEIDGIMYLGKMLKI